MLTCLDPLDGSLPFGAQRELRGAGEAEEGLRTCITKVILDLIGLQKDVDRHDDRTGLQDSVVDDRELRDVRAGHHDPIALGDPTRCKQGGHPPGCMVDLRVRELPIPLHHGDALGVVPSAVLQQAGEIQHRAPRGSVFGHGNRIGSGVSGFPGD